MPEGPAAEISSEARQFHQQTQVVDLHAHPSNKTYLFGKKLQKRNRSGGAFDPFAMRVDLPRLREGGVNVVFSSIYLLERTLRSDCFLIAIATALAPRHIRRLFKGDRFERTVELIRHLEDVVARTPAVDGTRLEVARSRRELEEVTARGNIAFLHAVEGGHSLEQNAANVQKFFDLGVSSLTLAHFYFNGVASPVDGVPKKMKPPFCFRRKKDLSKGLEVLGRQVVEEMVRLGMLIDMTHCTPRARNEVLELVDRRRPVLVTHVGVSAMKNDPMNPSDEEIRRIASTGGVVGVIAMNAWLSDEESKNGIHLMVETIKHIRDVGGIECPAFGSDFDGFTDPPDDLSDHSMMPRLTAELLRSGFSSSDVEKVIGGNALRALQDGWGR